MGFLGSVGKALGGFVKQVAPKILQSIAPAASKLLGGIAGDIFQKGAGFISKALQASPLPSPLKALAEKLLGKGAEKLTQLAQGGIDKLLSKLTEAITSRLAPGAGNVSLPGIATPGRQAAIAANNPAAASSSAPATASSGGAATTGSTSSAGGSVPSGSVAGSSGGPDTMPEFTGNPESFKDQQAHNKAMFAYQQRMSMMQQFWSAMSQVQKSNDEVKKGIARNY